MNIQPIKIASFIYIAKSNEQIFLYCNESIML